MLAYPCWFEPASQWDADDVGFVVPCRDLPEVATQGDDMAEAKCRCGGVTGAERASAR